MTKWINRKIKPVLKKYGLQQQEYVIKRRRNVHSIGEHRKEKNRNVIEIEIDKKVPQWLVKPYAYHEAVEDALERQKHYSYPKAHAIASHEEHKKFFPRSPKKWKEDLDFGKNLFNYRKRKKTEKEKLSRGFI